MKMKMKMKIMEIEIMEIMKYNAKRTRKRNSYYNVEPTRWFCNTKYSTIEHYSGM